MARLQSQTPSTIHPRSSRRPVDPVVWPFWYFFQAIRSNVIIIITRYISLPFLGTIVGAVLPQRFLNGFIGLHEAFVIDGGQSTANSWAKGDWYNPSTVLPAIVRALAIYFLGTVIYPYLFSLSEYTQRYWPTKSLNSGAGQYFKRFLLGWFIFDIFQPYLGSLGLLGCWAGNPLPKPGQPEPQPEPELPLDNSWWVSVGSFALGITASLASVLAFGRPWGGGTTPLPGTPANPYSS